MVVDCFFSKYYIPVVFAIATVNGQSATISEGPSTMVAALNSNISFTCSGYRYITWEVNALHISSVLAQNAVNQYGIFANVDDQQTSQLFILASQRNNNTQIRCLIRAAYHDVQVLTSEDAYLYMYGSPHSPSNVLVSQSGIDVHLTWEAPFSFEEENITYIVMVTNTRSGESRELETFSPELVFSESIGERDCSLYEFHVYSVNSIGRSNTGISDTERIPTGPITLQSKSVFVGVSFENGLVVTLNFDAPFPCDSYPIVSYNVSFIDQIDNSASFSVFQESSYDSVVLEFNNHSTDLLPNRLYLVTIVAENEVGRNSSESFKLYTTGLQSSSIVVLELNDTASVTCNFARGSDALGCEVSFYTSSMEQLLFAQNITREPGSDIATENIPLMGRLKESGSNITVLTAEWQADGSVATISIEAEINKAGQIIPTTSDTTTFDRVFTTTDKHDTNDTSLSLYTVIGAILGSIVTILLLFVICVVFVILTVRKRRRGPHTVENSDGKEKSGDIHTNRYISQVPSTNNSTQVDPDSLYSVIADVAVSLPVCEEYVVMKSSTRVDVKSQLEVTNPMYATTRDNKPSQDPTYEVIEPKQMNRVVKSDKFVVYDEVKEPAEDSDKVMLQGNASYETSLIYKNSN